MNQAGENVLQLLDEGRDTRRVSNLERSHQVSCRATNLVNEFSMLEKKGGLENCLPLFSFRTISMISSSKIESSLALRPR